MKYKKILLGILLGIILTILVETIILYVYYTKITSSNFAEDYETNLNIPDLPIIDESCYPVFDKDIEYISLDGQKKNLSDINTKVIFLNFWATWCIPCVSELKSVEQLYKIFKDKNIEFIILSNDKPEDIIKFKKSNNYKMPFYYIKKDIFKLTNWKINEVPTTFIITKNNKLALKVSKAVKWNNEETIFFINELVKVSY